MKLIISLLTASTTWMTLEIYSSINTIHFFNWWSMYIFEFTIFLLIIKIIYYEQKTIIHRSKKR